MPVNEVLEIWHDNHPNVLPQRIRVAHQLRNQLSIITLHKLIVRLILLIPLKDSLNNLDALQKVQLQLFISMLLKLTIKLPC